MASPLFAPTDIFSDELYERIQAHALKGEDFIQFWRNILQTGHITDLFMLPGWERSPGAKDEHQAGQELDLTIHYPNEEFFK